MGATEGWTPTDEDWCTVRDVFAFSSWANFSDLTTKVLATVGPIVARERRAAQVEALREAALFFPQFGTTSRVAVSRRLHARADEVERGVL